jgi:hypothetical protein
MMPRSGPFADFFLLFGFSHQSKTFAQEVRAIVLLPKGTEVLFPYNPALDVRAERRERLAKRYGFVCQCELCALPDDLSNALDVKIKQANDAYAYVDRYLHHKENGRVRVLKLLDTFVAFTIRERLYFNYTDFFLPVKIFAFLQEPELLQQVGNAVLRIFRRHLGSGNSIDGNASVKSLSSFIESAQPGIAEFRRMEALFNVGIDPHLDTQRKKTAASVLSNLQSLPFV